MKGYKRWIFKLRNRRGGRLRGLLNYEIPNKEKGGIMLVIHSYVGYMYTELEAFAYI